MATTQSSTTTWRSTTTTKTTDLARSVAALGLGGNTGDAERAFRFAIHNLALHCSDLRIAPLFLTHPISPIPQPSYLNTALVGTTDLDPRQLLGLAKALELAAGRRGGPRYGPRPLDIDLLLFGGLQTTAPELTLPHPRLTSRRFYLEPLARIAPQLLVPPDGASIARLLEAVGDSQVVEERAWSDPTWRRPGRR